MASVLGSLIPPIVFGALSSPVGAGLLDQNFDYFANLVLDNVTELRQTTPKTTSSCPPRVYVAGISTPGTGGNWYYYNPADTTSADNGFSIIVAADGSRWYASLSGQVQTAAESAAGVTPVNTQYAPGDLRRYGGTMDGVTDDSAAWASLALVFGQGQSCYCPPLPTMIKTTPALVAPGYKRVTLSGYGCTIYTTGAIYAMTVTGGFMGGAVIQGFTFQNTTDSLCLSSINLQGAQNCVVQDCWANISSTQACSGSYALVTLQPTTSSNDNTGAFWNRILRCGVRQPTGNSSYYAPAGVIIAGACNATEIAQCNFSSVNYAVQIVNQTTGGGTGTLANAVSIHDNAFEGGLVAVLVNGNSSAAAGAHIEGLRISNNRAESLTTTFVLFQGLTLSSNIPTQLSGNYLVSSVAGYIGQSGNTVNITYSSRDTGITPAAPVVVTFTGAVSGTSGTLIAAWALPSGWYGVGIGSQTPLGYFTYNSTAVTFNSSITGSPTTAIVWVGADSTQINSGPQIFQSTSGNALHAIVGAVGVGISLKYNNLDTGGMVVRAGGQAAALYGCTLSSTGTPANNATGSGSFSSSTTATITFPISEADTSYKILIVPTSVPPGQWYVSAKATGTATVTCATSGSWTFDWFLVR